MLLILRCLPLAYGLDIGADFRDLSSRCILDIADDCCVSCRRCRIGGRHVEPLNPRKGQWKLNKVGGVG